VRPLTAFVRKAPMQPWRGDFETSNEGTKKNLSEIATASLVPSSSLENVVLDDSGGFECSLY